MPEVLIRDERPGMTPDEKNEQLSAALALSPTRYYDIIDIKRTTTPAPGWLIRYK